MIVTVLGLLVSAAVGTYIFLPYFLGWDEERSAREEFVTLGDKKEGLMAELADLEYDFRTGKLGEEDYKRLRANLEVRLVELEEGEESNGERPTGAKEHIQSDRQS